MWSTVAICLIPPLVSATMNPLIKLAGPATRASNSAVGFAARICSIFFPSRMPALLDYEP